MIVDCYFNVRRRDFSIRYRGKVIEHDTFVVIRNAKFIVSEPGRQRVLASGQKNVHAYVRGELTAINPFDNYGIPIECWNQAYYSPYITDKFRDLDTKKPLDRAEIVVLQNGEIFYYYGRVSSDGTNRL